MPLHHAFAVRLTGFLSLVTFLGSLAGCIQTAGMSYVPFGIGDTPAIATGGTGGGATAGATITNSGAGGIAGWLAQEYPSCGGVSNAEVLRAEILSLVNRERAAAGLRPLRRNATLEAQAEAYACEMIQFDFFGHDNPVNGSNLRSRNSDFGYPFRLIGENLAAGQRTASSVMQDWMNSPGHRENILKPDFEEIGIGIRSGGDYGMYWVQEFGQPASVALAGARGR